MKKKYQRFLQYQKILIKKINDLKIFFENPKSIYPSLLFEEFLDMNIDLKNAFLSKAPLLSLDTESFFTIFINFAKKIKESIHPSDTANKAIFNLHSWLLCQIPFEQYKADHPMYAIKDQRLISPPIKAIEYYCVEPAPEKVRKLFDYHNIFKEAIQQLKTARSITIPLVALNNINNSVNILNRLFFIEYGSSAQADELTPLIHYTLLKAKITDLYSYIMYLNNNGRIRSHKINTHYQPYPINCLLHWIYLYSIFPSF